MSDTQPDSLYQRITDVCFENGGVSKRMVDKLHKLFEQELALYAPKTTTEGDIDEVLTKLAKETTLADRAADNATTASAVSDANKRYQWSIQEAKQRIAAHYQAKQDRAVREAENRFKSSIDRYELTRDYSKGNLSAPIMEYYRLNTLQKES